MAASNEINIAPSADLVPVRSILPEQRPGSGAMALMRNGSFRVLMRTGAVNFDMKSPAEQAALTFSLGQMVNSLDVEFPIQIVSHSKILDVDAYVRQFASRIENPRTPPAIRNMIQSHTEHFERQVKAQKLLQRELYIVVPFKGTSGPMTKSIGDDIPFATLLKRVWSGVEKRMMEHQPSDLEIATARQQLDARCDQIADRMAQMGIWAYRLNEDQLRRLFYELYHPALAERQRDPGLDTGGQLFGGFSAEQVPTIRRRLSDGGRLDVGGESEA